MRKKHLAWAFLTPGLFILACDKKLEPVFPATPSRMVNQAYEREEDRLSDSEKVGRLIWFNATGGNYRFFSYTFPQRILDGHVQWGKFLSVEERGHRFDHWGLINDPDCCTPGQDCEGKTQKTLEDTFGFEWCPGDDDLLNFVGKKEGGYKDPACDLKDTAHKFAMQSSCDLRFGTSTGALGFRKFPNPRFDAAKWKEINGGRQGTWNGFDKNPKDASLEPPFLIGATCGSCHISFDPVNPPQNPNHPFWENIKGTVGNQYIKNAVILGSGMAQDSLEWQNFKHERPGSTDTSALPDDGITNPGTINAIINFNLRPHDFTEDVVSWKRTNSGSWKKVRQNEKVYHFLKGGEDSIGAYGGIQRVYFNHGSCAEECWVNHLTDPRVFDPRARNFGETPLSIAQCRADCPNYRAIEDRVDNIFDFLSSGRPFDLAAAEHLTPEALPASLEKRLGIPDGHIMSRGKDIFVQKCASCHSSIPGDRDFDKKRNWMGNDELTPMSVVGTSPNRALHTNHMRGQVWDQYASETYKNKAGGGPGFYRNISLLSLWAFAPLLHNNAVGPDICPIKYPDNFSYDSTSMCVPFPVTAEERFNVFKMSMDLLLNPSKRAKKISKTDSAIRVPFSMGVGKEMVIELPAGQDVGVLGSVNWKAMVLDLNEYLHTSEKDLEFWGARKFGGSSQQMLQGLAETKKIILGGQSVIYADPQRLELYKKFYSRVPLGTYEDQGHEFGQELSSEDKLALIGFLATL